MTSGIALGILAAGLNGKLILSPSLECAAFFFAINFLLETKNHNVFMKKQYYGQNLFKIPVLEHGFFVKNGSNSVRPPPRATLGRHLCSSDHLLVV